MARVPSLVREAFAVRYRRRMEEEALPIIEAAVRACKAGDSKVLLDTLNRFLGRPVQALEVIGPGGTPGGSRPATAPGRPCRSPMVGP